jgi:dTDP-4-dehydrorhamnose 3,5-epimerase
VLSESAEVEYKCNRFYDPADELAIIWNDPAIGVEWPVQTPILSAKDSQAPPLDDVMDLLPQYKGK